MPHHSTITCSLTDLIKKPEPNSVDWTTDCDAAFKKLKRSLHSVSVLRSNDFKRPFVLQTDPSERDVGAMLSQTDDEGAEHLIGYFSRKLLPKKKHYATVEKECSALKLSVQAFPFYLLGRHFIIQTNYHSFT